jgi:hypothetical protein
LNCLSGLTGLGKTRNSTGGCLEVEVSLSPPASGCSNENFPGSYKIFQGFPCFAIGDDGSCRNLYDNIVALFSGFLFSLASGAIFGFKVTLVSEIVKRTFVGR